MTLFAAGDGNTSLSPEEQLDLIPDLSTRQELNEWERQNIVEAYAWATAPGRMKRRDPLTEPYLRELHRRMFDQTWRWAGIYRATEKNIGVPHYQVREMVPALLGDVRYWVERAAYPPDELAIRFHHRLVFIHPFANGNGRHARLIADVLVQRLGSPQFTWGRGEIVSTGELRRRYIAVLKAADKHDLSPLLAFARS